MVKRKHGYKFHPQKFRVDEFHRENLWNASQEETTDTLLSTRKVLSSSPPPLTSICIEVVINNFKDLYESANKQLIASIQALPDIHRCQLIDSLVNNYTSNISSELAKDILILPPNVKLDASLPAFKSDTPSILRSLPPNLTSLELIGFTKLSDKSIIHLIKQSPGLRKISLRGCLNISAESTQAISTLESLESLDVSFTNISPQSLSSIMSKCKNLVRLDARAIGNSGTSKRTSSWEKMLDDLVKSSAISNLETLSKLEHLNVAESNISDASLGRWLTLTSSLKVLDCGYCESISNPYLFLPPNIYSQLTKINLSNTSLDLKSFTSFYQRILMNNKMKVIRLSLVKRKSSSIEDDPLLTDDLLTPNDDQYIGFSPTDVDLSNNIKLFANNCLNYHITKEIRYLNLSNSTLNGEAFLNAISNKKPSNLENLQLNNCNITDNVILAIKKLKGLKTLSLKGTNIDESSLNKVIDSCENLSSLNLTQCRGINLYNRRRYFEYYEEIQQDNNLENKD